jgi:hypothetical protein
LLQADALADAVPRDDSANAARSAEALAAVRKAPILRHFVLKNDRFAKTDSGQT